MPSQRKKTLRPTPTLDRLMLTGAIKLVGQDYEGLAADGEWVNIGLLGYEDSIEAYLESNPNPSDW